MLSKQGSWSRKEVEKENFAKDIGVDTLASEETEEKMERLLRLSVLLTGIIVILLCSGCGKRYRAEQLLAQKGLEWSKDHYLLSARDGDAEAVKIFINGGMNPNDTDSKGLSPLLMFAERDNKEMLEWLLQRADIMLTDNSGRNALHHALKSGHFSYAPILVEAGIDITQTDSYGRTPLHYAAGATGTADLDTIVLLVKKGADIHKKDKEGATPLLYAAKAANLACVKQLVAYGASLSIRGPYGKPIYELADKERCEQCHLVAEWLKNEYQRQTVTLSDR